MTNGESNERDQRAPELQRGYERRLAEKGVHLVDRHEPVAAFCWFCDRTAGKRSREHVFPQLYLKLVDRMDDPTGSVHFSPTGELLDERGPFPTAALTAGGVCEVCNGGWMSRLEARFKARVDDRLAEPLSREDLVIAAHWFAKTATVINVSQQRRVQVPENLRHGLDADEPPAGFKVWLFRSEDPRQLMWQEGPFLLVSSPGDLSEEQISWQERTFACVVVLDQLCGLVVYDPPDGWATPGCDLLRVWPDPPDSARFAELPLLWLPQAALWLTGVAPGSPPSPDARQVVEQNREAIQQSVAEARARHLGGAL